jgi:hypothetical protein
LTRALLRPQDCAMHLLLVLAIVVLAALVLSIVKNLYF